jgi:hypothetical protein
MVNKRKAVGRCQRGVAGLEAALILPVMIFLVFGCFELYQYHRAAALMDRVSFTVANGVAMQRELFDKEECTKSDDICVYRTVAQDLFQPLDYAARGGLTISAYAATASGPNNSVVWKTDYEWRKAFKGTTAHDLDFPSRLDDKSTFPPARVGDTIIVAEVFYDFEPFVMSSRFWASLAGTSHMYSRFFFRPRFDDLRAFASKSE